MNHSFSKTFPEAASGVFLKFNGSTFSSDFHRKFEKPLPPVFWEVASDPHDCTLANLFSVAVSSELAERSVVEQRLFEELREAGVFSPDSSETTKVKAAFRQFRSFKRARQKIRQRGYDTQTIEDFFLNRNYDFAAGVLTALLVLIVLVSFWTDDFDRRMILFWGIASMFWFVFLGFEALLRNTFGEILANRGLEQSLKDLCKVILDSPANFIRASGGAYDKQVFNQFFELFEFELSPEDLKNTTVAEYIPPPSVDSSFNWIIAV